MSEAFGEEGRGKRWHQLPGGMELAKRVWSLTWDAQGSVLLDSTDEIEEECLRWVVCGGYQDRSLSAEPDRGDSITAIGWVEEAVLAQTPGGLDGNTGRGHDAPGREGVEAENGIGVVQVWKQGRLNRAGECPEGLDRRRREGRGVPPARSVAFKVSASLQKRLLMTMGAGGSSPAAPSKGINRVCGRRYS